MLFFISGIFVLAASAVAFFKFEQFRVKQAQLMYRERIRKEWAKDARALDTQLPSNYDLEKTRFQALCRKAPAGFAEI